MMIEGRIAPPLDRSVYALQRIDVGARDVREVEDAVTPPAVAVLKRLHRVDRPDIHADAVRVALGDALPVDADVGG